MGSQASAGVSVQARKGKVGENRRSLMKLLFASSDPIFELFRTKTPFFRFPDDVAQIYGARRRMLRVVEEENAPEMKPRAGLSPSRLAAAGLRSASIWRTRKSRSRTAWGGGNVSARSRSRAARGDFFGATRKRVERFRREEYTLRRKRVESGALAPCLVAYLEAARRWVPREGR